MRMGSYCPDLTIRVSRVRHGGTEGRAAGRAQGERHSGHGAQDAKLERAFHSLRTQIGYKCIQRGWGWEGLHSPKCTHLICITIS